MKEAMLICERCGHQFVAKIFERGEAEAKQIPHYPIRCEKCHGPVRRAA